MSFTDSLYQLGTPILNDILHHPFISDMKNNQLNQQSAKDYVEQDMLYLTAYTRGYIEALHQAEKEEDILFLAHQVIDSVHGEDVPHRILYDGPLEISHIEKHLVTEQYMNHIYRSVQQNSFIAILTTMLPCSWTYFEIASYLLGQMDEKNPLRNWASFYFDDGNLHKMNDIINREAKQCSHECLKDLQQRFIESCRFEYLFWNQSYLK